MTCRIRRMFEDDVPQVAGLEKDIFSDPWSEESFAIEVKNIKLSYPFVIEYEGKLAAYAVVWHYLGEAHIGNFAVAPAYRRKGFGRQLMEHILDKFKTYEIIYLEVRRSNESAIKLYGEYGFAPLYLRQNYYADGEDAVVMVKDL